LKRRIKMDKMLVVVFDSEIKAYEGSRALQELQNEGSINLYAKAVIARDASGKVTVKQRATWALSGRPWACSPGA
jgi:uncharacterized membrane protein